MGDFATPGKLLGTEEEVLGGEGAYEEGGKVYSLYTGESAIGKDRITSVKPCNAVPKSIAPGMVVYGRIEDIFEPIALVKLESVEIGGTRQAQADYFSILHVSSVKRGYTNSLRDEVRVGDVIKAVISEIRRGEAYLDMKGPEFGVVKAYCSRCRSPLYLKDRLLVCHNCGNREGRKLSTEYSAKER